VEIEVEGLKMAEKEKNNLIDWAKMVVNSENLNDKLLPPPINAKNINLSEEIESPFSPGRSKQIEFSEQQIKFPRKNSFVDRIQRGKALHFFANHELQAIEMMTAAILRFPQFFREYPKHLIAQLNAIKDEQRHFNLYLAAMKDRGVTFGDFPLSGFFWRSFYEVKNISEYFSLLPLTFESANLDFCIYYKSVFEDVGDSECAQIMNVVLNDEIRHVNHGVNSLKSLSPGSDLWQYYIDHLPGTVTPARSKGIEYQREPRIKSGLPLSFVESVEKYKDNFLVTDRKGWN
jgi:uncharacterized ferritin-like protein (DUF455 family)